MKTPRTFVYYANSYSVIDGDTVDVDLDIGLKLRTSMSVRLTGIDAPELKGSTKLQAVKVRNIVSIWLSKQSVLCLRSDAIDDKYGRMMGTFLSESGAETLNQFLLTNKLALPYAGGTKAKWTAEQLAAVDAWEVSKWVDGFAPGH